MSSNSFGQIFLINVRNSLPSFIAQRSSVNLETLWYLYALEDPLEISWFINLDLKPKKKSLAQNGTGSVPIGIPVSYNIISLSCHEQVCLSGPS